MAQPDPNQTHCATATIECVTQWVEKFAETDKSKTLLPTLLSDMPNRTHLQVLCDAATLFCHAVTEKQAPWYADFANYLAANILPVGMTYQQRKKFKNDVKSYF